MNKRKIIPKKTETAILTKSKRRCAICFGLNGDISEKRGQIAHLDRNSVNDVEDNLAFLCLNHHDEYDSMTSQSKGLTEQELKAYREQLYQKVARLPIEANTLSAKEIPHFPLLPLQMQIVIPSYFGRLNSVGGQFSLLLTVTFRNESTQPVLLKNFLIQYADKWYDPQFHIGNIFLFISTNTFAAALHSEDNITKSLRIPEMAEITRHAFFILPDPPEPFPGPERLNITVKATFVQRSPQQIAYTLTDRGKIEQEDRTDSQEDACIHIKRHDKGFRNA